MARITKTAKIKRGDLWAADLHPGVGWELAKTRPILIVSSNIVNLNSSIVVGVPLSSQIPDVIGPERVLFSKDEAKLGKDSVAMIQHIRGIDKARLTKKIGSISPQKMTEVEGSLKIVLALEEIS